MSVFKENKTPEQRQQEQRKQSEEYVNSGCLVSVVLFFATSSAIGIAGTLLVFELIL